jgi:hypothetical protein
MYWIVVLTAFTALVAAHTLRLPMRAGLMPALAASLAGFAGAAIGVKLLAATLDFGRTTEFDAFVNHAARVAQNDDAPLIVFSGASFSRNAIDEVRLTEALRARGYPHRVTSLSLEAASLIERDTHLTRFIAASPRVPDIVFIEISQMTDYRPTFIFGNSKFSTRAIDQFDARGAAWSILGLSGGGCNGAADCAKEAVLLSLHAGLNGANAGLISMGEPAAAVAPMAAFEGPVQARKNVPPAERSAGLSQTGARAARSGPEWAASFRRLQQQKLAAAGVRQTAYYFPPVISPDSRSYAAALCTGELKDFTCLAPDDANLLKSLDGEFWLDEAHLLDAGAAIYTEWLADQIVASGVLEAAP